MALYIVCIYIRIGIGCILAVFVDEEKIPDQSEEFQRSKFFNVSNLIHVRAPRISFDNNSLPVIPAAEAISMREDVCQRGNFAQHVRECAPMLFHAVATKSLDHRISTYFSQVSQFNGFYQSQAENAAEMQLSACLSLSHLFSFQV